MRAQPLGSAASHRLNRASLPARSVVHKFNNVSRVKVRQNSKACDGNARFCSALPAYYETSLTSPLGVLTVQRNDVPSTMGLTDQVPLEYEGEVRFASPSHHLSAPTPSLVLQARPPHPSRLAPTRPASS